MELLSGPWADLVLLLRQTVLETDRGTDGFFPLWLFGLLMFMSVCLLLLQLIVYFSWKLRQAHCLSGAHTAVKHLSAEVKGFIAEVKSTSPCPRI